MARRRPDLRLSLVLPVWRYRCASARCGWHGKLRAHQCLAPSAGLDARALQTASQTASQTAALPPSHEPTR